MVVKGRGGRLAAGGLDTTWRRRPFPESGRGSEDFEHRSAVWAGLALQLEAVSRTNWEREVLGQDRHGSHLGSAVS